MKKNQSGFTLIELMIVVAIIGILAAIAIPSYMDYQKKAKASELLVALSPAKAAVSEFIVINSRTTEAKVKAITTTEAGVGDIETDIVQSVAWDNNVPAITVTGTAEVDGLVMYLKPAVNATTGSVAWNCYSAAGDAQRLAPASCRTTLP